MWRPMVHRRSVRDQRHQHSGNLKVLVSDWRTIKPTEWKSESFSDGRTNLGVGSRDACVYKKFILYLSPSLNCGPYWTVGGGRIYSRLTTFDHTSPSALLAAAWTRICVIHYMGGFFAQRIVIWPFMAQCWNWQWLHSEMTLDCLRFWRGPFQWAYRNWLKPNLNDLE